MFFGYIIYKPIYYHITMMFESTYLILQHIKYKKKVNTYKKRVITPSNGGNMQPNTNTIMNIDTSKRDVTLRETRSSSICSNASTIVM